MALSRAARVEDELADWAAARAEILRRDARRRGRDRAFSARERLAVRRAKVEVVDTVGAGDSFMSALLSAMDRDGALGAGRRAARRALARALARFRRLRLGDHLHPQGLESAERAEVEAQLATLTEARH